jgi:hypothetical protein
MEGFGYVRDLLLWVELSCCVEKHAVVGCGWISWSAVWETKLCCGWKILISGEAHVVGATLHLVGKHTMVCYRWTNLPAVWMNIQYVLDKTIMLCGLAHDVLWKRCLQSITLSQGMKFCGHAEEKLLGYGIVLLCRQNIKRAVTLSFFTFHKKIMVVLY